MWKLSKVLCRSYPEVLLRFLSGFSTKFGVFCSESLFSLRSEQQLSVALAALDALSIEALLRDCWGLLDETLLSAPPGTTQTLVYIRRS